MEVWVCKCFYSYENYEYTIDHIYKNEDDAKKWKENHPGAYYEIEKYKVE